MSTLADQLINERLSRFCGHDKYVGLKKHGVWYRPNSCGYTAIESEAGRYTTEEAKAREYRHGDWDDQVTICHFTPPNFFESRDALQPVLEKLNEEQAEHLLRLLNETMERRVKGKSDGMACIAILTVPPRTLAAALYEVIGETK
jgi:hypothetical protein